MSDQHHAEPEHKDVQCQCSNPDHHSDVEGLYCKTCGKQIDVCPYGGKHPLNG